MSEGFLSRWSRRKQATQAAEPAESPPHAESAAAPEQLMRDSAANFSPPPCGEGSGVGVARCGTPVPNGTPPHPDPPPREVGSTRLRHQTGSKSDKSDFDWGRESAGAPPQPMAPDPGVAAFDPASLPALDSITAATDIRAFLAAGVPAELTRAALRRVWSCDPKIRDFVGLADYAWDFNAPGSMAGFGPLAAEDALRAQAARWAGPVKAEDSADAMPGRDTDARPQAPASDPSVPDPPDQSTTVVTENELSRKIETQQMGDELTQPGREYAAAQPQQEKPEDSQSTARRKHGRALPEP
jgi:hypothetical protein